MFSTFTDDVVYQQTGVGGATLDKRRPDLRDELGYIAPPNRKLPPVPGSNYNTCDRIKRGTVISKPPLPTNPNFRSTVVFFFYFRFFIQAFIDVALARPFFVFFLSIYFPDQYTQNIVQGHVSIFQGQMKVVDGIDRPSKMFLELCYCASNLPMTLKRPWKNTLFTNNTAHEKKNISITHRFAFILIIFTRQCISTEAIC